MEKKFCFHSESSFFLISGPCVIENYESTYRIASYIKEVTDKIGIPFIFKASYDKANRTSSNSFRGPGINKGLDILARVQDKVGVFVMSDVHQVAEVSFAARVLDVLQIPAFLCRQTDLLFEVAKTGKPINIKKGQFLSPGDLINVVNKILLFGNSKIMITERGVMFGYNNLVVDFRGIQIMKKIGCPIIFDATHSVQLPSSTGEASGGECEFVSILAKAAIAVGVNGIFLEVHEDPELALCDGQNSVQLNSLEGLLYKLKDIRSAISS